MSEIERIDLVIDAGNSGTKVSYKLVGQTKPNYFLMSSSVEVIEKVKFERYRQRKGWLGSPAPERQAWLECSGELLALGDLAMEFDCPDRREEPKYENALYKVLAAIGIIVEKHQLNQSSKKLKVRLGVLLPWNEYSDRHRFQKKVEQLCDRYSFRGQTLRVKLEQFSCRPEGAGLAMTRLRLKGEKWFREQRLGILMLGDRNLTGLYFEQGELKEGDSPMLGFSFMLDEIIERTSSLNRDKLRSAIFEALHEVNEIENCERPVWEEATAIQSLATARDLSLRLGEVKDIADAIATVAQEWDEKIQKWLQRIFPTQLTEISVAGGPSLFFKPMLERYYNCSPCTQTQRWSQEYQPLVFTRPATPIIWGAGILKQVEEAFELRSPNDGETVALRFVDPFGVFDFLIKEDEQQKTA